MTRQLHASAAVRRWLLVAVTALLAAGVWASTESAASTSSVDIRDFSFQPQEVTVHVGDTVTWTNRDGENHAVQGGPLDSPDIPPGGTYSHTFGSTGDVAYICRIHTYMNGVVHVVGDNVTTTSTTSTTAAPSTTTTAGDGSTTTTTAGDGSTTTTTAGDGSTTTTTSTTASPSPSGGPPFQDVPDDPSATYPPGTPGATTPPPQSAPTSSTTTTTQPGEPPDYQDVPNDPSGSGAPGSNASADSTGERGTDLGDGTFLAPYTTEGGVKTFRLAMAPTTIEVAPGVTKDAYAFNGIVPGPVLRVNEGDKVRIVVDNQLPFDTAVHWHGMILPNDQDGVPGLTQPPIEPGARYTYEWTAVATGTHWYHAHSSGRHIGKVLYGALEVVPKAGDFAADRDYRLLLGDTDLGFVINGRMFPSTKALQTKVGETVHLRIIDTGDQVHAIHLHGIPFDVVAQDGNKLAAPMRMDTLTISPGQTFDLIAKEPNPGKWLLHCHIFAHSHMSADHHPPGDTGMTGMVTVLDVAPAQSSLPPSPLAVTTPISTSRSTQSRLPMPGSESLLLLGAAAVAITGLRTRVPTPHIRKEAQQ